MNLSELLADKAARYEDRSFLFFERQSTSAESNEDSSTPFRQTLSYRELDDRVNQACHYLAELGMTQGSVYNLHLPNCPAFIILWFAAARLGAVMIPTNVLASADELTYLLEHSGSEIAFTTDKYWLVLDECQDRLDHLKKVVLCDPYARIASPESFESKLAHYPYTPWKCTAADTDLVAIMYTSGTTSKPKGVMVNHANYITAGRTVADSLEIAESDRQFTVLPLFHGNAQYYSTMSVLLRGASMALMDRFSASQYFDKCIEYDCTVASLFAAPMRMILAKAVNPAHRRNSLRIVIYAQNITEQQMQDWQSRFNAPLAQIWGMTETMGPPLMNPLHGERRNRGIGKPSGDYEIRLVDESGNSVRVGEPGEITVAGIPGKSLMLGYFENPEATAETIREDWLYTGDNAIEDDEGFFYFIDRKKDMIKRSGENISAGEVENVILQHPAVFECAVIGMPDEIKDELIVGVVVLKEAQTLDEAALIEFCMAHLASFRVPERIEFVDSLPKTSVGKIQKHIIRQALIKI